MQCHGVCKNTVSSRNFALSILQSEVWEDTVKDEKSRGFFKAFSFLYYFLLSLFSPSGNNTPDWLWHSTWDREATEMECFPKRMLRICQLWSTSGFLSWPSVSQSVSQSVQSLQSCPTLCDPMNCSTPGLPVHHQLLEFTQTHVHRVGDAIQPSHPLSSPSPVPNPSQHQGLQFITIYKKMLWFIITNIFMFQFFTYKVSRTTTKKFK